MAGGMIASLIFNGIEMGAEAAQRASLLKKYKQDGVIVEKSAADDRLQVSP